MNEKKDVFAIRKLIASLKSDDKAERLETVNILMEIGEPAVEALIDTLKDKDSRMREKAAGALGKLKNARAVEPLIDALSDRSPDVRFAAAWALGQIKDARSVSRLCSVLKDQEARVRFNVLCALREIKRPRAVEFIIPVLKDEDELVREKAEEVLFEITGRGFGSDYHKWMQWWEENKANLEAAGD